MARTATATAGQRLSNAAAAVTIEPLTMACWINPVTLSANRVWMGVAVAANNDDFFLLATDSADVAARKGNSSTSGTATAGAVTTGSWQHIAGTFTGNTARAAFRDGANKGTDTTNVAFGATPDRTGLLHNPRLSVDQIADGSIAHAAIWNVVLTDDEIAALGKGMCPVLVRPQSLVAYWPVGGVDSPEPDRWRGTFPLTLGGSLAKAENPRIYMPAGVQ